MSEHLQLTICGLGFQIQGPPGVDLVERDPLYQPFLDDSSPVDGLISSRLHLERVGPVDRLPVLFDTGETWTAYAKEDDVLLRLRTVGDGDAYLWQARLEGARKKLSFRRTDIHCGPRLLEASKPVPVLANPLHYPLDQLVLMFALPAIQGLLVHACGVSREDSGVVLAGPSGAGKTTFMRQCADRADLCGLSDDRIVIRRRDGTLRLFGTPWAGEGRVARAMDTSFGAMAFLHHGDRNEVRDLTPARALRQLLPTASILWFDRERLEAAMALCEEIVSSVPCYEVHFVPGPSAADLLDQVL